MKFNKKMLMFVALHVSLAAAVVEDKEVKIGTTAYQGKKIVSKYMDLLNSVLVKFPTTTLRMAMAADRGQKAVDAIATLNPIGVTHNGDPVYFETEALEYEYVKKQLDFVLAPVEKFMEDIKEHRAIVKNLLEYCLGAEKTKNSFIYKSFDVEGSFLAYFSKTIKTVPDLNTAATEFLMFFADINASISAAAKTAYDKLLDKISANRKQKEAAANKPVDINSANNK